MAALLVSLIGEINPRNYNLSMYDYIAACKDSLCEKSDMQQSLSYLSSLSNINRTNANKQGDFTLETYIEVLSVCHIEVSFVKEEKLEHADFLA